jgi:hypothetical protein
MQEFFNNTSGKTNGFSGLNFRNKQKNNNTSK